MIPRWILLLRGLAALLAMDAELQATTAMAHVLLGNMYLGNCALDALYRHLNGELRRRDTI